MNFKTTSVIIYIGSKGVNAIFHLYSDGKEIQ